MNNAKIIILNSAKSKDLYSDFYDIKRYKNEYELFKLFLEKQNKNNSIIMTDICSSNLILCDYKYVINRINMKGYEWLEQSILIMAREEVENHKEELGVLDIENIKIGYSNIDNILFSKFIERLYEIKNHVKSGGLLSDKNLTENYDKRGIGTGKTTERILYYIDKLGISNWTESNLLNKLTLNISNKIANNLTGNDKNNLLVHFCNCKKNTLDFVINVIYLAMNGGIYTDPKTKKLITVNGNEKLKQSFDNGEYELVINFVKEYILTNLLVIPVNDEETFEDYLQRVTKYYEEKGHNAPNPSYVKYIHEKWFENNDYGKILKNILTSKVFHYYMREEDFYAEQILKHLLKKDNVLYVIPEQFALVISPLVKKWKSENIHNKNLSNPNIEVTFDDCANIGYGKFTVNNYKLAEIYKFGIFSMLNKYNTVKQLPEYIKNKNELIEIEKNINEKIKNIQHTLNNEQLKKNKRIGLTKEIEKLEKEISSNKKLLSSYEKIIETNKNEKRYLNINKKIIKKLKFYEEKFKNISNNLNNDIENFTNMILQSLDVSQHPFSKYLNGNKIYDVVDGKRVLNQFEYNDLSHRIKSDMFNESELIYQKEILNFINSVGLFISKLNFNIKEYIKKSIIGYLKTYYKDTINSRLLVFDNMKNCIAPEIRTNSIINKEIEFYNNNLIETLADSLVNNQINNEELRHHNRDEDGELRGIKELRNNYKYVKEYANTESISILNKIEKNEKYFEKYKQTTILFSVTDFYRKIFDKVFVISSNPFSIIDNFNELRKNDLTPNQKLKYVENMYFLKNETVKERNIDAYKEIQIIVNDDMKSSNKDNVYGEFGENCLVIGATSFQNVKAVNSLSHISTKSENRFSNMKKGYNITFLPYDNLDNLSDISVLLNMPYGGEKEISEKGRYVELILILEKLNQALGRINRGKKSTKLDEKDKNTAVIVTTKFFAKYLQDLFGEFIGNHKVKQNSYDNLIREIDLNTEDIIEENINNNNNINNETNVSPSVFDVNRGRMTKSKIKERINDIYNKNEIKQQIIEGIKNSDNVVCCSLAMATVEKLDKFNKTVISYNEYTHYTNEFIDENFNVSRGNMTKFKNSLSKIVDTLNSTNRTGKAGWNKDVKYILFNLLSNFNKLGSSEKERKGKSIVLKNKENNLLLIKHYLLETFVPNYLEI